MLEDRLSDKLVIAFTGNEENGMRGALGLGKYCKAQKIQANVIVTDVTYRGNKGKNAFSLENRCYSAKWTHSVMDILNNLDFEWKLEDNYEVDETCAYYSYGFECFSLCIPTKGEMPSNSGIKARISTYDKYIEALCMTACVT